MFKKLNKDKRGIFGLNAVQQFFVLILAIALLAYVIVIIFGSLDQTTILVQDSGRAVANQTLTLNTTGGWIAEAASRQGCVITSCILTNATGSGVALGAGNYTLNSPSNCWINATNAGYLDIYNRSSVNASCTISYNSNAQINTKAIMGNTSSGVTGFFSSVSPVYAILAVLVIILVLVVLVRVVSNPASGGREQL